MAGIRRFLFSCLVIAILSPAALARPTVVIDAGHGGHDRGGGPGQRIPEKPYALDVARRVRIILNRAGYRTVMTRDGDYFVTLGGRCAIANSTRNAIFVSIHFNSASREGADGIETYYFGASSAKLAATIHPKVVRAAGTEDRRVRRRGFYVLRRTNCPAVLVECGFLTNGAEARRITSSSAHRQKLAEAIASGIMAIY